MALTETACRNAKCSLDRAYQRYSDEKGLYLEVTRNGLAHEISIRWKGKLLVLGHYPEGAQFYVEFNSIGIINSNEATVRGSEHGARF